MKLKQAIVVLSFLRVTIAQQEAYYHSILLFLLYLTTTKNQPLLL